MVRRLAMLLALIAIGWLVYAWVRRRSVATDDELDWWAAEEVSDEAGGRVTPIAEAGAPPAGDDGAGAARTVGRGAAENRTGLADQGHYPGRWGKNLPYARRPRLCTHQSRVAVCYS